MTAVSAASIENPMKLCGGELRARVVWIIPGENRFRKKIVNGGSSRTVGKVRRRRVRTAVERRRRRRSVGRRSRHGRVQAAVVRTTAARASGRRTAGRLRARARVQRHHRGHLVLVHNGVHARRRRRAAHNGGIVAVFRLVYHVFVMMLLFRHSEAQSRGLHSPLTPSLISQRFHDIVLDVKLN